LEVFRSLFVKHAMDLDEVSEALDNLLYLNNCGSLWQCKDLTQNEKEEVYSDARRPVEKLEKEFKKTQQQLVDMIRTDTVEYTALQKRQEDVRERLQHAKENASAEIYSQMNKAGSMGKVINSEGEIQLDFHGLGVKEAKDKIDQMVLPVLPVVNSLIIITGRGLHSSNKTSVLKIALRKYLTQKYHETLEHEVLKENKGAVRVRFKAESMLD